MLYECFEPLLLLPKFDNDSSFTIAYPLIAVPSLLSLFDSSRSTTELLEKGMLLLMEPPVPGVVALLCSDADQQNTVFWF